MRLLCALLGHVFERPPERIAGYVYGDCGRCGRYVLVRADRTRSPVARLRSWMAGW